LGKPQATEQRLLDQFQRDLGALVGLCEHGRAVLHHHVIFGEVCCLRGDVNIRDLAGSRFQIGLGDRLRLGVELE